MKNRDEINIYWANLCILNRMEGEKMTAYAQKWAKPKEEFFSPIIHLLGETAEVDIYQKLENDIKSGALGFDAIVSTRLDLFYSSNYLQSFKNDFLPLKNRFKLRPEIEALGVMDPAGLFLPVVVLPHFIIVNTKILNTDAPRSLEDLLKPEWAGRVLVGPPELPSAKSILLAVWYLFGDRGLETAVQNWRKKSAPSAARHSVVKDEAPIAILPGIFGGAGPDDRIKKIIPLEGSPVLPSFASVKHSENEDAVIDFLKYSALSTDFIDFYRSQAFAYPAFQDVSLPENIDSGLRMIFPSWDWINKQDFQYFEKVISALKFS
ncbi:MAG: ABC transporter substrate-binding protein [Spirochaetales bacterium]|nr:ABC transporter substrate-binding protein [Spirochaetales bacterium]